MRKYFFTLIVLLITQSGFSQKTVELSFKQFITEYNSLLPKQPVSNYQVTINNLQYLNAGDSDPLEKSVTKLTVTKETCFAYESTESLLLQNEKVRVNVDTSKKVVYLLKPIEMKSMTDLSGIQSLDSVGLKIKKTTTAEKVSYSLEQMVESSSFKTIKLEFSIKTNQISKVEVFQWPGDYLNEDMGEIVLETPKTVFEYADFKKLTNDKIINEKLFVNYWITEKEILTSNSKSQGYVLNDLRIKK